VQTKIRRDNHFQAMFDTGDGKTSHAGDSKTPLGSQPFTIPSHEKLKGERNERLLLSSFITLPP
jgi:hypothetical protein